MKQLVRALLFAWTIGSASSGLAAPQVLRLDLEKTHLSFSLGSTLHEVHGTLHAISGEIRFDLATGEASGRVVIDSRRTETGNRKRDKKMHSEVLESERYPEIAFTAQSIDGSELGGGPSELVLYGVVTIHGHEHELALRATVQRSGNQISARCRFPVPFVEWGMKDPSVFVFRTDKHVDVTLDVQGVLS